jgi:hypothetical protein
VVLSSLMQAVIDRKNELNVATRKGDEEEESSQEDEEGEEESEL